MYACQENCRDVSLDQLMGGFNHRIAELQQLILIRGVNTTQYTADLSALDVTVKGLEQQLHRIKARLKCEAETLSNARTFVELSLQQHGKIQQLFANLPPNLPGGDALSESLSCTPSGKESNIGSFNVQATPATKEKKGKGPPPRCYVCGEEFTALSSYMKGRLTLDKVNSAIDEMATFAEANARLLATPRRKIADDMVDYFLELREIAHMDVVKGKYFFLEQDMRGQILKLDNTGKAILTILRHLGRTSEIRLKHHRVFTIVKV